MAIDFPNSPVTNDNYTVGGRTWSYDGEKWTLATVTADQSVNTTSSPTFAGLTISGSGIIDAKTGGIGTSYIDGTFYTNVTLDATIAGTVDTYGLLQVKSGMNVEGTSNFTDPITIESVREKYSTASVSSNVITLNYSLQSILYQAVNITANFTVNVTNLPTDNGYMNTISIFVEQGATGYRPSTLQIEGTTQTIKWSGGTAPTPTSSAGKIDLFSFTLIRRGSAWTVLGSANLNY